MTTLLIPRSLDVCPLCGGKLEYAPHPRCTACHETFEYDYNYKVFRNPNIVDISYRNPESSLLSNLFPHSFNIGNISFASMEAFLRSLCWNGDLEVIKNEFAPLFGVNAVNVKYVLPDWRENQALYYFGRKMERKGDFYKRVLEVAYGNLFTYSHLLRMALFKTKGKVLIHSIGKDNPQETLLTRNEFISNLNMLRERL
ncbi:MAG: hypothetical protein IJ220_05555 [Clostridia bacterium]|nr:hypothetical protein [Clostridia bacterium]